jgi:hypothetical protein
MLSVNFYPKMDYLDRQLQVLIHQAPEDGQTPQIVQAIAPALKIIASQLRHPDYYILQTPDKMGWRWVLTTLSNRTQPKLQKQVIYAFSSEEDAQNGSWVAQGTQAIARPIPVTHILFQTIAIDSIDSLVFFETPGDLSQGTEVSREKIQLCIQAELKKTLGQPTTFPLPQIPKDLA